MNEDDLKVETEYQQNEEGIIKITKIEANKEKQTQIFQDKLIDNIEFKYVSISKNLFLRPELTLLEKHVLSLLCQFSFKKNKEDIQAFEGSNQYLALYFSVSESRISQILSKLTKLKLIYENITRFVDENGFNKTKRFIYPTNLAKILNENNIFFLHIPLIDLIDTLIYLSGNLINYSYNNIVNSIEKYNNINKLPEVNCSTKNQFKNEIKRKNKYHPITENIIDLFLKYNKKADKDKNYTEDNKKFTSIYINKYIKEFNTEKEFIDSYENSLKVFLNQDINKMDTSGYWFNTPYKADIQSNYLYHRNKNFNMLKKKDKFPTYTKEIAKILNIDITENLISFVSRLANLNHKIRNKSISGYTRDQLTPEDDNNSDYTYYIKDLYGFMNEFVIWLDEKTNNENFKWEEKFFDNYMKEFNRWFMNRHDNTTLFPLNETMQWKLEEYLERNK